MPRGLSISLISSASIGLKKVPTWSASNHYDDADCGGCGNDINDDDDNDEDVNDDDDDGGDDDSDKDDNGNNDGDNDEDNDDDNDNKIDNNNIGYSFTRSCSGTGSKLLSS